jgi:uncharacterized membrane protein YedE/YeeE
MRVFSALVAGALFGVGLLTSGMVRPDKVLGFLDVAGQWDPSLAWVMVGAIGVHLLLRRLILKRARPLLSPSFQLPSKQRIDRPLIAGAAIFGVGWGLGGYCPGPSLVTAATGTLSPLLFVGGMLLGMVLTKRLTSPKSSLSAAADSSLAAASDQ